MSAAVVVGMRGKAAAAALAVFLASVASACSAPRYQPVLKEIGARTLAGGKPVTGAPIGFCLYLAGDQAEPDYLAWTATIMDAHLGLGQVLAPRTGSP